MYNMTCGKKNTSVIKIKIINISVVYALMSFDQQLVDLPYVEVLVCFVLSFNDDNNNNNNNNNNNKS